MSDDPPIQDAALSSPTSVYSPTARGFLSPDYLNNLRTRFSPNGRTPSRDSDVKLVSPVKRLASSSHEHLSHLSQLAALLCYNPYDPEKMHPLAACGNNRMYIDPVHACPVYAAEGALTAAWEKPDDWEDADAVLHPLTTLTESVDTASGNITQRPPAAWYVFRDVDTMCQFFVDVVSGETRWMPPEGIRSQIIEAEGCAVKWDDTYELADSTIRNHLVSAGIASFADIDIDLLYAPLVTVRTWCILASKNDAIQPREAGFEPYVLYYHNTETGVVQWDVPEGLMAASAEEWAKAFAPYSHAINDATSIDVTGNTSRHPDITGRVHAIVESPTPAQPTEEEHLMLNISHHQGDASPAGAGRLSPDLAAPSTTPIAFSPEAAVAKLAIETGNSPQSSLTPSLRNPSSPLYSNHPPESIVLSARTEPASATPLLSIQKLQPSIVDSIATPKASIDQRLGANQWEGPSFAASPSPIQYSDALSIGHSAGTSTPAIDLYPGGVQKTPKASLDENGARSLISWSASVDQHFLDSPKPPQQQMMPNAVEPSSAGNVRDPTPDRNAVSQEADVEEVNGIAAFISQQKLHFATRLRQLISDSAAQPKPALKAPATADAVFDLDLTIHPSLISLAEASGFDPSRLLMTLTAKYGKLEWQIMQGMCMSWSQEHLQYLRAQLRDTEFLLQETRQSTIEKRRLLGRSIILHDTLQRMSKWIENIFAEEPARSVLSLSPQSEGRLSAGNPSTSPSLPATTSILATTNNLTSNSTSWIINSATVTAFQSASIQRPLAPTLKNEESAMLEDTSVLSLPSLSIRSSANESVSDDFDSFDAYSVHKPKDFTSTRGLKKHLPLTSSAQRRRNLVKRPIVQSKPAEIVLPKLKVAPAARYSRRTIGRDEVDDLIEALNDLPAAKFNRPGHGGAGRRRSQGGTIR